MFGVYNLRFETGKFQHCCHYLVYTKLRPNQRNILCICLAFQNIKISTKQIISRIHQTSPQEEGDGAFSGCGICRHMGVGPQVLEVWLGCRFGWVWGWLHGCVLQWAHICHCQSTKSAFPYVSVFSLYSCLMYVVFVYVLGLTCMWALCRLSLKISPTSPSLD